MSKSIPLCILWSLCLQGCGLNYSPSRGFEATPYKQSKSQPWEKKSEPQKKVDRPGPRDSIGPKAPQTPTRS